MEYVQHACFNYCLLMHRIQSTKLMTADISPCSCYCLRVLYEQVACTPPRAGKVFSMTVSSNTLIEMVITFSLPDHNFHMGEGGAVCSDHKQLL